ncbi:hypothetical protein CI610_01402 [invertebrate metagenome]|uniref:Uncharacterized protein n=1 Tax=invertebrate metagenome TaxID=1711999 RepID=A0A2H9T8S9_9ZZZZ
MTEKFFISRKKKKRNRTSWYIDYKHFKQAIYFNDIQALEMKIDPTHGLTIHIHFKDRETLYFFVISYENYLKQEGSDEPPVLRKEAGL